jgi:hypothetical protein
MAKQLWVGELHIMCSQPSSSAGWRRTAAATVDRLIWPSVAAVAAAAVQQYWLLLDTAGGCLLLLLLLIAVQCSQHRGFC